MEPATVTPPQVPSSGAESERVAEQEPPPPTFGKSSLLMLVVAVAIYAYQVRVASFRGVNSGLGPHHGLDRSISTLVKLLQQETRRWA